MDRISSSHRLVIVTGKGGVGRSAVAAALARGLAAAGEKTILVTQDTRDDRHDLLDAPLAYAPQPQAANLWLSRVDALGAIRDYARRRLPLSSIYERFFRSRAFRDFAAAAPGFDELMCLGRLYDLATAGDFDRVVFDGPATGHFRQLMDVPEATLRAVAVGPVSHNALKIQDLLLDRDRTLVQPVTLAEEMPVREVLELAEYCHSKGLGCGPVIVNRTLQMRFAAAELIRLEALAADLPEGGPCARAVGVALREAALAAAQERAVAPLAAAGLETLLVPRLVQDGFDAERLLAHLGAALDPLCTNASGSRRAAPRPSAGP